MTDSSSIETKPNSSEHGKEFAEFFQDDKLFDI